MSATPVTTPREGTSLFDAALRSLIRDVVGDQFRIIVREELAPLIKELQSFRTVSGSQLLTVRQCATEVGVHAGTVERWVRLGKLKAVHVGRSLRIRREDLDAFLSQDGGSEEEKGESVDAKAREIVAKLRGPRRLTSG